ncbi:MAG: helix-turn-helix domain-containing protein [Muribaculaceae bacterium]|nr:helix-turn-helix domain-containing protein [Muribaculaceae bacterium]
MAELRQLNLAQLKQLVEGNDETLANNYISRNLAVARNVRIDLIKDQLSEQPTLMPEMRILIIKKGWTAPIINMMERRIEVGDLVFLGSNGILQYKDAAPDVQGIGLSISDELFSLAIGNRIPRAFDGHLRDFQLHLAPEHQDYLDQLHLMLFKHLSQPDSSSQVTLHLVSAFLWYVDQLWSRQEQTHRESQSREQRLFTDFIQLVSEFAPRYHTIDFYASRLCLTPHYLSAIIRQVSGKTAKQWIDDALVTRIKIELKHTEKPIARIGDDMGFPNPSFLVKFFKRMTGMTPSQFRQ